MQCWSSRLHDRAAQRAHRMFFVISGTWRVNSGENVDSEATVTRGGLTRHTMME
jgi:hypothetical protein